MDIISSLALRTSADFGIFRRTHNKPLEVQDAVKKNMPTSQDFGTTPASWLNSHHAISIINRVKILVFRWSLRLWKWQASRLPSTSPIETSGGGIKKKISLENGSGVQEAEATPRYDLDEPIAITAPAPVQIVAEKTKVTPRTTIKVADLLKVEPKKENVQSATPLKKANANTYTADQLQLYWAEFSQQRKKFQAEFQLLSQPYEVDGTLIKLSLLSPVQETMLKISNPIWLRSCAKI